MKLASAATGIPDAFKQHRIGEKITLLNHQINFGDVHVHNAACADVQMTHLTVSHLAAGQSYMASAGMNERVRELLEQTVVVRLARQ